MKLLGSTQKKDVDKDKNGENVPKVESVEVNLVHCNLVKNDYQHKSFIHFSSKQTIWTVNKYFALIFKNDEHSYNEFTLVKFGLQMKLAQHSKMKIMSI